MTWILWTNKSVRENKESKREDLISEKIKNERKEIRPNKKITVKRGNGSRREMNGSRKKINGDCKVFERERK